MIIITENGKQNLILFPKTVDYYQIELTRMLETERYSEAIDLLSFLLQCQADDEAAVQEWKALHQWLIESYPSLIEAGREEEETEASLLKQRILAKAGEDQNYAKSLLDVLLQDPSVDHKLVALEQLAYIDHPNISDTLKRWVENVELHPVVQFKVLQTLKTRGAAGPIKLDKSGETVNVNIEDTPMSFEQFAPVFMEIRDRVHEISEVNQPALSYFAEQTWKEFLYYIYGTSVYRQLLKEEETGICVWSAALHLAVVKAMMGSASDAEIMEYYGITDEQRTKLDQAGWMINGFMATAYLPGR